MPKYHFFLVSEDDSEHVGTIELPHRQAVVPAGIKLTAQLLASTSPREIEVGHWAVHATDDSGDVVYKFDVAHGANRPSGYVH